MSEVIQASERALISDLLKTIERAAEPWKLKDHGCEECVPGEDVGAAKGFRCARHRALALLAQTKTEALPVPRIGPEDPDNEKVIERLQRRIVELTAQRDAHMERAQHFEELSRAVAAPRAQTPKERLRAALASLLQAIWHHEKTAALSLSGGPLKAECDAALKLLGEPHDEPAAPAPNPHARYLRTLEQHLRSDKAHAYANTVEQAADELNRLHAGVRMLENVNAELGERLRTVQCEYTSFWEWAQEKIERACAEPESVLDYRLPCDVHLPPNTYIGRGCLLSTLMNALRVRERNANEFPVEFTRRESQPPADVLRDAERYRWIRGRSHAHIAACWLVSSRINIDDSPDGFDAAIDEARGAVPKRGNQAEAPSSGGDFSAPTPRGSLPNSLGTSPADSAERPACDCEGPRKIGPGFHAPYCATMTGTDFAKRHAPADETGDGR